MTLGRIAVLTVGDAVEWVNKDVISANTTRT